MATVEQYTQTSLAFAIADKNVVFQSNDDRKSSKDWLIEDLGVTEAEYETVVRGGLFPDRITISVGSDYNSACMESITASAMLTILAKYKALYGRMPEVIHNGQFPEEPGKDWKPRQVISL